MPSGGLGSFLAARCPGFPLHDQVLWRWLGSPPRCRVVHVCTGEM